MEDMYPSIQPEENIEEIKSELVGFPTTDIDTKLANVDKAFELIGKLRKFALKHLSPSTITNEGGKPYIMENGVNVFDAPFGIYEKNVSGAVIKEGGAQISLESPDAFKGTIICIIYKGIVGSRTLGIEFSFEGGVYYSEKDKKFHDKEDFLFFCKKAKSNWRGRARRKLLGLDNITWDELKDYNITPQNCATINRSSSQDQISPEMAEKENKLRAEIQKLLTEYLADPESRSTMLEELSAFTGKDGAQVPGVRTPAKLKGKRLEIVLGKVKEWHEKTQKNWGIK